MDLLTYKETETGPDAPANPSRMHRAWHWLLSLSPTVVTVMIALSIGLCMVAVQISQTWVMVVLAIFWGLTAVAMVGVLARWMTPGPGRHRVAS
ncbi:hypothetical protein ACFYUY_10075 [Kitasatospora sp. NPDC004745]|uniref:hypothetical protein n=1 Tax=unclassified Kitasatospora TaxID=2633591 RepID=UPI0033DDFB30